MLRELLAIVSMAPPAADAPAPLADTPTAAHATCPRITVRAGAVLPMFLPYEFPGPLVAVSAAWPLRDHLQVVATVDTGVLAAAGTTRIMTGLGVGVRATAPRPVPLWAQLGVGVTGYVERIGVELPAREVTATDLGAALTLDAAIGIRFPWRWELVIAYDQQLVTSEPGDILPERETLTYVGTASVTIGREL